MTSYPACPVCGGTTPDQIFPDAVIPLLKCSCGLVFQSSIPSQEELESLYGESYYKSWGLDSDVDEITRVMKRSTFRNRLSGIPDHLKKGRILDVGCATGYFLEEAQNIGLEPWGVEISPYSAAIARQKFEDRIYEGTLETAGFPEGHFDVITLSDLLEHVTDPTLFLREVKRILAENGLLMIVTPNVASLSARLMADRWTHFKREHIWYFSPGTIKSLLALNGFQLVSCHGAKKYLSIDYVHRQFSCYRHPVLTPVSSMISSILPPSVTTRPFPVFCGEMLVTARKQP